MQKRLLSIIVTIALLLSAHAAQSQYYLGVIQGEAKKIPIVVLDIREETGNQKLRTQALETLRADLVRSQIFEVTDPKTLDLAYAEKSEPSEAVDKARRDLWHHRRCLGVPAAEGRRTYAVGKAV